jgi:short-subunit dehydrogenase
MATALITGGTSGIGAAFAELLAARGYDLVLVARNEERLAASKATLYASRGINVETISADLANREDVARVAARIEDPERPIELLINNAGIGVHTKLTSPDVAVHEHAFDVMCRAVLVLGGAAGRAMRERGDGAILNVSSLQGLITTGSYSAMKAWVTSYSQSLAVELRGSGVTVTALLPGWVSTEWHARAGVRTSSIPDWLWIEPERVARAALADVDRGRVISIPTVRYRVLGWFARHLPRTTIRWISGKISSRRSTAHRDGDGSEQPVVKAEDN